MHKKIIAIRQRVGNLWVALFYERIGENLWHVGININKSRRAQSDWYKKRKNKRARRANQIPTGRSQRGLAALYRMFKDTHIKFPAGSAFVSIPTSKKREAISKYIERLGFTYFLQDDLPLWVLITPQSPEE